MKNILVTGGAGFIGSHLVKHFVNKYDNYNIINLDLLTYASNISHLDSINNKKNYSFIHGDIRNLDLINKIFEKKEITHVIHLAAESHVDRSIKNPFIFVETNVNGTINLLEASKRYWQNKNTINLFHHVSTDEVYGSLGDTGYFTEKSNYDPHSPYSSSKASSDHFVRSYYSTYNLPITISNCSNNFGPHQHYEKLIPTIIKNIYYKKSLPIYGDGKNIRDWLFVSDHINAIDKIFHSGKIGESYNIGGDNEYSNIDLISLIIEITDKLLNNKKNHSKKLISFTEDRLGHDYRYAIDSSKIKSQLKWEPINNFKDDLTETIKWYIKNLK